MILITGASGFVGKHLNAQLSNREFRTLPLSHATSVRISDQQWECDLTRPNHLAEIEKVTEEVPDTIIHLAGHVEIALKANPFEQDAPPLPGREDVPKIYAANIGATINVLSYCLHTGVRHLIFASSQAVYGMPTMNPLTEQAPCNPLEHYAMSKFCCEQILNIGSRHGLAVTVLRFPGIFSEDRHRGVVFRFCQQAIQSGKIFVKADYPLPLDVIHLDDVTDAFIKAVSWGGQEGWVCLNIATGEPCNLNILADSIAEHVPDCQVHHSVLPQPVVCMDSSNAHALLGWRAIPRYQRLQSMIRKLQKT